VKRLLLLSIAFLLTLSTLSFSPILTCTADITGPTVGDYYKFTSGPEVSIYRFDIIEDADGQLLNVSVANDTLSGHPYDLYYNFDGFCIGQDVNYTDESGNEIWNTARYSSPDLGEAISARYAVVNYNRSSSRTGVSQNFTVTMFLTGNVSFTGYETYNLTISSTEFEILDVIGVDYTMHFSTLDDYYAEYELSEYDDGVIYYYKQYATIEGGLLNQTKDFLNGTTETLLVQLQDKIDHLLFAPSIYAVVSYQTLQEIISISMRPMVTPSIRSNINLPSLSAGGLNRELVEYSVANPIDWHPPEEPVTTTTEPPVTTTEPPVTITSETSTIVTETSEETSEAYGIGFAGIVVLATLVLFRKRRD